MKDKESRGTRATCPGHMDEQAKAEVQVWPLASRISNPVSLQVLQIIRIAPHRVQRAVPPKTEKPRSRRQQDPTGKLAACPDYIERRVRLCMG